ncbi:MAG: hypothetical protein HC772_18855 [Leptolyngbyaceae cyanobacterium CRU_2_3]|nr:hypothetical protein [Leptolyngbyaceae cyanobacterium CRU_2_3]
MFTSSRADYSVDLNIPLPLGIRESKLSSPELNGFEHLYIEQATPFRKRDEQVMIDLFRQEGIEAIEQDIAYNLLWRCPEPCWEDDPFEFLRDFL